MSLGEGILWVESLKSLLWVDIAESKLFRRRLCDDFADCWRFPIAPTSVAAWHGTRILLTTAYGLQAVDLSDGQSHKRLVLLEEGLGVRMNDGATDPMGRFWFGSMDLDEDLRNGKLYCLHTNGSVQPMLEGIGICNGITFARSGRVLYFSDSAAKTIYRCEIDTDSAQILNKEIFVGPDLFPGSPDGATVDDDGFLWSCRWDGWSICRFDTEGELKDAYEVPVQRPTRCAFGGPDLKTLYVTTARIGLDEIELARQPLAGSVLSLRVPHVGTESHVYAAPLSIEFNRSVSLQLPIGRR